jgi:hypothetical protein
MWACVEQTTSCGGRAERDSVVGTSPQFDAELEAFLEAFLSADFSTPVDTQGPLKSAAEADEQQKNSAGA